MKNFIAISVYRKKGNRVSLVFRKNKVLYRITSVENGKGIINELNLYGADLVKGNANPQFILKIDIPGNRCRVLEIGLEGELAKLYVYEALERDMKLRFTWIGTKDDIVKGFRDLPTVSFFIG
nr:hypothetical protein [Pedobacter panaciterrae]